MNHWIHRLILAGCLVLSMLPVSCVQPPTAPPASDTPASSPAELSDRLSEAQTRIEAIEAEKAVMNSRLEEFAARNDSLTARLNDLQFENKQQREQIAALAEAPKERDALRAKVDELSLENHRLARQVEQLQSQLAGEKSPAAASQPSSAPTSQPASEPTTQPAT